MFAVIFDMDGVIFDTEKIWKASFLQTAKRLNLPLSEVFRQQTCGKKMTFVKSELIDLYGDFGAKFVDMWVEAFQQKIESDGAPIKSGFHQIRSFLGQIGAKTALATGSSLVEVMRNFSKVGLCATDLFDKILTCDNVQKGKPNPEIYIKAASALGKKPADCFVLEDSPNGIVAAHKAGCKVIMVVDLIAPTPELRSKCVAVCENLKEAQTFLENAAHS